jgi:hypothetical protein
MEALEVKVGRMARVEEELPEAMLKLGDTDR